MSLCSFGRMRIRMAARKRRGHAQALTYKCARSSEKAFAIAADNVIILLSDGSFYRLHLVRRTWRDNSVLRPRILHYAGAPDPRNLSQGVSCHLFLKSVSGCNRLRTGSTGHKHLSLWRKSHRSVYDGKHIMIS